MLIHRSRALILWASFLTLCGCSVGRFDPTPSHGIDMAGSWVLNREASDDPKPILDKLRPKTPPRRGDTGPDTGTADDTTEPTTGGGAPGGGQRGRGRRGDQGFQVDPRRANDAYRRVPVMQMLTADIARADHITIRQSSDSFSLDYGVSVRTFTPGAVSVVSAEWGVADQRSGWHGKEYVIRVKPQSGVASEEIFSLSADGKRLTEDLKLGGGDYQRVELHRVYDRTDRALPRAAPTND
jgi:hypothetical protein